MPDDRIETRPSDASPNPGALVSLLVGDFTDLMQKEIALAKGELQQNINDKIMGSVWFVVAGVVFLLAAITLVVGLVFLVASFFDIALHWAAFAVTGALIVIGAIIMAAARSKMSGDTLPTRSMTQVKEDIRAVKEQMQ
jgi:uncharacterized membrane protein YqjE